MEKSKAIIAPLILLLTISAFGQGTVLKNKEIGISVFTLEANSETLNTRIEPKFVFGAFYNQYFSNLSWISSVNYGNNTIDDDCPQCADMYYGKGHMTEFGISSGLRYTFLRKRRYFIKPFIESDLCYSNINYKGEFGGGYDGKGINIDFRNNTFGILGRVGLSFQPISQVSLTISSSLRSSTGRKINRIDDSNEKIKSYAATCLEIRLGYGF